MPTFRLKDGDSGETFLVDRPSAPNALEANDLITAGIARPEGGKSAAGPMAGPAPTPTPGKGILRSALEDIQRPESIGGIAGAAALAPAGAPAGPLGVGIMGAVGAALGGAAGELYRQSPMVQMGVSALGGDPSALLDQPGGPGVSASTPMDMAKAGTWQAANQALAEGGISLLKLARPAVKAGAGEAWRALEPYMPRVSLAWRPLAFIFGSKEPPVIAGEATKTGVWSAIRNIAEYSIFNGGTNRQRMGQEQALRDLTDHVAKSVGGSIKSEAEMGQLLAAANTSEFDARNLVTAPIYNLIASEAEGLGTGGLGHSASQYTADVAKQIASGGRVVDNTWLRGRANTINRTLKDTLRNDVRQFVTEPEAAARSMSPVPALTGGPMTMVESPRLQVDVRAIKAMARRPSQLTAQTGSIAPNVSGSSIWDAVANWPDTVDWASADQFRKELGSMVRSSTMVPKGAPARGVQKAIDKTLNESMRDSLTRINRPDLVDSWDTARGITRQTQEEFNPMFINKLLRAAQPKMGVDAMGREVVAGLDMPSNVFNATFGRGNADAVRMIRRSVDKKTYENALGLWMGNTIQQATDPATGNIVGRNLDQLLQQRYSSDFLDAAFKGGYQHALDGLQQLSRVATFTQANESGIGKIAIQLRQGGMMVQVPRTVLGAITGAGAGAAAYGAAGPMGAATVFIGPMLLGRMLTNPKLARLIVIGASKPEAAAGRAVASVLARAAVDLSHSRTMDEAAEEAKANQLYGPALQNPDIGQPLQAPISRAPHAAPPSPR